MLTSTLWQDYKGYKRSLGLSSNIRVLLWISWALFLIIVGIVLTVMCLSDFFEFWVLLIFPAAMLFSGIYILFKVVYYLFDFYQVNRVAYDIELNSGFSYIIRTRKGKYGIVRDCKNFFDETYPSIILSPKYDMIKREGNNIFLVSKKKSFPKSVYYGLYNCWTKRMTIPIRFDSITRPDCSADLFIAKKNGHVERFNSMGDRIIR